MRYKIECTTCTCVNCFVKKYCSGDYFYKISDTKNQNFYKRGDYIFREGNNMFGIHFIQGGGVKLSTPSMNGREQVVRLASEGSILGARVLGNDKYYFNAIALMDTNVCFIETALFRDALLANPELSYNLMLFFAYELRRTELRVKYHSQMNIREKVAESFVYLNEVFGTNAGSLTLNVYLSRQEIAFIAGTTPEQVSRQLSDFEAEGLIERNKREIKVLNKEGLKNIVMAYKID